MKITAKSDSNKKITQDLLKSITVLFKMQKKIPHILFSLPAFPSGIRSAYTYQ